ncbi:MAG: adenylate kinase [Vulcanimicrobiaceae bacterium]
MVSDVVLLGGPGAGKGTQAQILQKRFGYRQISTGDLLRAHREGGTPLGREAQGYMQRGELVPDGLIVKMVEGELRDDTAVLFDGFPRTAAQARALDAMLTARGRGLPWAVYFEVPRRELESRLLGRWSNPRTGRVYNERSNPPHTPGVDDEDGGPLVQRDDDKPETVAKRLDVFEAQTMPLVSFYRNCQPSRLTSIDAARPVDAVTHDLLHALQMEHAHE